MEVEDLITTLFWVLMVIAVALITHDLVAYYQSKRSGGDDEAHASDAPYKLDDEFTKRKD